MTEFKRIFLDTAPLIYFLNENSQWHNVLVEIFNSLVNNGGKLITSAITCEEYMVHPYRYEDVSAINAFWNFIDKGNVALLKVDSDIAVEAAKIRAEYIHFKPMDALQLAAAICSGCDVFLTNDKQLKQFDKISCVTVDEWSD